MSEEQALYGIRKMGIMIICGIHNYEIDCNVDHEPNAKKVPEQMSSLNVYCIHNPDQSLPIEHV